jgi:hypothetical protein
MDIQERVSPAMIGSFQSYFIPKIHELLVNLNEEKIKDLIRGSISKSPEGLLKKLIDESGNSIVKNRDVLEKKGNRFGIINSQSINKNPWSVPYYDHLTETIDFISWNTTNKEGIEYKIIINNTNLVYIPKVYIDCWAIRSLGKIEEINSIIVLENEIIRDTFYLNLELDRELFKKMSYRVIED